MSLKTIRTAIAADTGYHPDSSDDDKIYLNNKINEITYALYNETDLIGSLFEIIVYFDLESKLVSFPWYVGHVRGVRYYDNLCIRTLRDIRPRYATNSYGIEVIDFREIGISSLAIQLTEWSLLKFSLPEGEVAEKEIKISIIGETPTSSQKEEIVVLASGENNVTTVNNWMDAPRIIQKDVACLFDITITDIEDTELAIIPNSELKSLYSVWQVADDTLGNAVIANSLEVLYKERFKMFVNDGDEFLMGRYDDAIAWKFLSEYWSKMEGKGEQAQSALNMYAAKMAGVNRNNAKGKKAELQTVPNKFYGLFNSRYYRGGRYIDVN